MEASLLLERATLARGAERFEDMTKAMKRFIEEQKTLSETGRDLFFTAYQNLAETKEKSWSCLNSLERKHRTEDPEGEELAIVKEYKKAVGDELCAICREVIKLLDDLLLPGLPRYFGKMYDKEKMEDVLESQVFYQKMKGDFYCYMYRVEETQAQDIKLQAEKAYTSVIDLAKKHLTVTNDTRLGLVLSYSVFINDILKDGESARKVAREAFDEAVETLEYFVPDERSKTLTVLKIIRDNCEMWAMEAKEHGN